VPVVNTGDVKIVDGTAVTSAWVKPPRSPRALMSGAPDGGLMRSFTAVSSNPLTIGAI